MQTLAGLTPGPYDITIRKDRRGPVDDGVGLLADLITPDARVAPHARSDH